MSLNQMAELSKMSKEQLFKLLLAEKEKSQSAKFGAIRFETSDYGIVVHGAGKPITKKKESWEQLRRILNSPEFQQYLATH